MRIYREMLMDAVRKGHNTAELVEAVLRQPKKSVQNHLSNLASRGALLVVGKQGPVLQTGRSRNVYAVNPDFTPPTPRAPKKDPQQVVAEMIARNAAHAAAAERRRERIAARKAARRHAQADAVDSPQDYAEHALAFWPDVQRMKDALSSAKLETRKEAMRIILERKRGIQEIPGAAYAKWNDIAQQAFNKAHALATGSA